MSWTVKLSNSAKKEYRHLDDGPKGDVSELIDDLEEDPSLVPAIELRHIPGTWRARFHHDHYRIIYQVLKKQRLVIVKRIRPRPTAYLGMKNPQL